MESTCSEKCVSICKVVNSCVDVDQLSICADWVRRLRYFGIISNDVYCFVLMRIWDRELAMIKGCVEPGSNIRDNKDNVLSFRLKKGEKREPKKN